MISSIMDLQSLPQETLDEILLTMVEGVGSLTFQKLYEYFGDCGSILSASSDALIQVAGIGPKLAGEIVKARENYPLEGLLELCVRENIGILTKRDEHYPELLRLIYDPPQILYFKGTLSPMDALGLAVVGTRRFTSYGSRMTKRLTQALSAYGITIVSGLAKGIDGVAHRAALESGGRTLAVLGSGLSNIYPSEHERLAEEICNSGAILSEYHPLMGPTKGTFPQRNRIVAGMTLGVLVVEAPKRSGAMITARLAGELGRDIFAVPGSVESPASEGCHQLIRDGAVLTESVEDIIETLGPLLKPMLKPAVQASVDPNLFRENDIETENDDKAKKAPELMRHPGELRLNEIEQRVLNAIATTPTSPESVREKSELQPHQIEIILPILERARLIRKVPGKNGETLFVRI